MTWARFFDAYEPVHGLVAESDGKLLGLTHYLFHRSTTAIEPSCYLQDLFTSEAARGKGVGRALINGVYEHAKLAGSPRVYWQTHETNVTAQSSTTRSPSAPASSSIARCFDACRCTGAQAAVDKSAVTRALQSRAKLRLRLIRPPVADHAPQAVPVSRRV